MSHQPEPKSDVALDPSALRVLKRPIAILQRRLRLLAGGGWDINTLYLLAELTQRLAGQATRERILDLGSRLVTLNDEIRGILNRGNTPTEDETKGLLERLAALSAYGGASGDGLGSEPPRARRLTVAQLPEPEIEHSGLPAVTNIPNSVAPPDGFLAQRIEEAEAQPPTDAPAAMEASEAPQEGESAPDDADDDDGEFAALFAEISDMTDAEDGGLEFDLDSVQDASESGPSTEFEIADEAVELSFDETDGESSVELGSLFAEVEEEVGLVTEVEPAPAEEEAELLPSPSTRDGRLSLYVLHGGDGTTAALRAELEKDFEVQSFTDPVDFLEILSAIGPDGVIMDDAHLDRIDDVGPLVRKLRAKTHGPLSLVVLSARLDVQARLRLMRTGANLILSTDLSSEEAANRIREQLLAVPEDPFRVLIVEDDRSQGIFAKSILDRAGMEARIETDPLQVLESMTEFEPDLILMDLHMPGCDGMELTTIIRERDEFVHTPIVFLSGEDDEDMQFDALLAGGDDFLSKPIRPRHLVSAVKNRVRRARSVPKQQVTEPEPADDAVVEPEVPGILEREALTQVLTATLEERSLEEEPSSAGLLYVETDRIYALRKQYGLPVLADLGREIEPRLLEAFRPPATIGRYGDAAWCVLWPGADLDILEQGAQRLVAKIAGTSVSLKGEETRITVSVGACALGEEHEDAAGLVAAAERLCNRDADETYGRVGVQRKLSAGVEESLRDIGEAIMKALDENGFQLVYQPIVSLQGQEVDQYQCLLRLPREDDEPLAPASVLSAAEELGMVEQIDRWVLGQALDILADSKPRERPLQLFVNQSGAAANDPDLAGWLVDNMERRGVSGGALTLEFKLQELARSLKPVISLTQQLGKRRIRFCLGQFDGSETGFRILEHYRAAFVKIRPEVALRQLQSGQLKDTVRRLHDGGAEVIVPGVEEAQLAVKLWSAGVEYIQGHLVQRPESELSYNFAASE